MMIGEFYRMRCSNCNTYDHEPGAKFCHVCGSQLGSRQEVFSRELLAHGKRVQNTWERLRLQQDDEDEHSGFRWTKVFRYLLLLAILIEYFIISIKESSITDAEGVQGYALTTIGVNILIFICTLALCANIVHFEDKKRGLRLYYEWLHFLTAALMPILGFWIVSNIQNGWTLLLDGILVGVVLLVDFVLPDLID